MAYFHARCEVSPGGFLYQTGLTAQEARSLYERCQAGTLRVDPSGTKPNCGWYGTEGQPLLASFSRTGYNECTYPPALKPPAGLRPMPPAASSSSAGIGTKTKVALGAAALAALYLVTR